MTCLNANAGSLGAAWLPGPGLVNSPLDSCSSVHDQEVDCTESGCGVHDILMIGPDKQVARSCHPCGSLCRSGRQSSD